MLEGRLFESVGEARSHIDVIASELEKNYGVNLGQGTEKTGENGLPIKEYLITDSFGTRHLVGIVVQEPREPKLKGYEHYIVSYVIRDDGRPVFGRNIDVGSGRVVDCLIVNLRKGNIAEIDRFFMEYFVDDLVRLGSPTT